MENIIVKPNTITYSKEEMERIINGKISNLIRNELRDL